MDDNNPNVAPLDPTARKLRHEFLGWQCRIRQLSVRQSDGRPTPGMRPRVSLTTDETDHGHIVVLIRKKASHEATARFQHLVRRTRDPAERRDGALNFLAAAYYQRPDEFSDHMTALFAPGAVLVQRLLEATQCTLDFEQFGQHYRLTCQVKELAESEPGFQFTYWHNSLFNPTIPGDAHILGFQPDWSDI
jgi:hypothetical protein